SNENQDQSAGISELFAKMNLLEQRIDEIEGKLDTAVQRLVPAQPARHHPENAEIPNEEEEALVDKGLIESNIFEYGLAWFGSLVLLFGIAILSNFARNYLSGPLASLVGYASVAGVFFLAWHLRSSFSHLSFMLNLSAHLLVYYITLRLFFFIDQPVIPVKGIVLFLLFAVICIQCYLAIKQNSELQAVITLILSLATSIFADITWITLPLLVLTAAFSIYLFTTHGWWRQMLVILYLVYASQSIWLLNNPVMGNPVGAFATHPFNLISLLIYGSIFSFVPMVIQNDKFPAGVYPAAILINGMCFSVVMLFVVVSFYMESYVWIFSMISGLCLFYSIFLKYRTNRVFDPAFFAIYSFMALSVAVYGYSKLPDALWLLALQSLLVVSWALWFRSKIIVVMNTILFIGIMVFYMAFYPPVDKVNFAFVVTAFVSARIINWKKERLTLKTEMIRNIYLIALFVSMLFALYHVVPKQYITLSWTFAAVFYFIMSMILKNIKYRWMAIATVLFAGFYHFFVDFSNLETGYRVLAFLFLAAISLGASLYFTKKVRKKIHSMPE
ncbi:MAG: hypothetical protein NTW16_03565, partial [Bacteroidetes bacterium]|nr:hypothetical protein [Bacteroidota bacterium]